jgi:hypothetical protein
MVPEIAGCAPHRRSVQSITQLPRGCYRLSIMLSFEVVCETVLKPEKQPAVAWEAIATLSSKRHYSHLLDVRYGYEWQNVE